MRPPRHPGRKGKTTATSPKNIAVRKAISHTAIISGAAITTRQLRKNMSAHKTAKGTDSIGSSILGPKLGKSQPNVIADTKPQAANKATTTPDPDTHCRENDLLLTPALYAEAAKISSYWTTTGLLTHYPDSGIATGSLGRQGQEPRALGPPVVIFQQHT
jgi:hypothetical protein